MSFREIGGRSRRFADLRGASVVARTCTAMQHHGDAKRNVHVHLALNEVEKAMVVRLAEHTGLSLSDVMRSALRAEYRTTFGSDAHARDANVG